jgi:hypothetical protein
VSHRRLTSARLIALIALFVAVEAALRVSRPAARARSRRHGPDRPGHANNVAHRNDLTDEEGLTKRDCTDKR